ERTRTHLLDGHGQARRYSRDCSRVLLAIEFGVARDLEVRNTISSGSRQFQPGGRAALDVLRLPFYLQSGADGCALIDRGLLDGPAGWLGPLGGDGHCFAAGRKLGGIETEQLPPCLLIVSHVLSSSFFQAAVLPNIAG